MLLPKPADALHKAWLYRLLSAIYDEPALAKSLAFKGGTCAAMLGWLNRFSVDLDFDYVLDSDHLIKTQTMLEKIFKKIGLTIHDKSKKAPQYFLKYPSANQTRNTLKLDTTFPPPRSNTYAPLQFNEIDRIITCQTAETMFANKLVALIDRWEKTRAIAGRDVYDIHAFFLQGFAYNRSVIEERRGQTTRAFLESLVRFIEKQVQQTTLSQDLNVLLPIEAFQKIRKVLKQETLIFLNQAIENESD